MIENIWSQCDDDNIGDRDRDRFFFVFNSFVKYLVQHKDVETFSNIFERGSLKDGPLCMPVYVLCLCA